MKEGYTDTKENGRWWVYCRLDNVYIGFDYEVGVAGGSVGEAEHEVVFAGIILKYKETEREGNRRWACTGWVMYT